MIPPMMLSVSNKYTEAQVTTLMLYFSPILCMENVIELQAHNPLAAKVGNHFADKRRSLGRYSSLTDSDHGVFFFQAHNICIILR
jgi:hypothetical protein